MSPAPDTPIADQDRRAAFARLFAQHHRWLHAYLLTLLGDPSDSEEVFQEVCVVLWREYESFDLSTSFVKWASVIAHNQVRRFRRTRARHELVLADDVVDLLAEEAAARADLMESRRVALHGCLQKLSRRDRDLVEQCYSDERATIRSVAERMNRPVNTVYKALNRIRRALHACIDRQVAAEGAPR